MTNEQAYERGVTDVVALMNATVSRLETSDLLLLRRELAIETLRVAAAEARALIDPAAVTDPAPAKTTDCGFRKRPEGGFDQAGNIL